MLLTFFFCLFVAFDLRYEVNEPTHDLTLLEDFELEYANAPDWRRAVMRNRTLTPLAERVYAACAATADDAVCVHGVCRAPPPTPVDERSGARDMPRCVCFAAPRDQTIAAAATASASTEAAVYGGARCEPTAACGASGDAAACARNGGECLAGACRCALGRYGASCEHACARIGNMSVCGVLNGMRVRRWRALADAEARVSAAISQRCIDVVHELCLDAAAAAEPCRTAPVRIGYLLHVDASATPLFFARHLPLLLGALYLHSHTFVFHLDARASAAQLGALRAAVEESMLALYASRRRSRDLRRRGGGGGGGGDAGGGSSSSSLPGAPVSYASTADAFATSPYIARVRRDVSYRLASAVVMRRRLRVVYGGASMARLVLAATRALYAYEEGAPTDFLLPLNAMTQVPLRPPRALARALESRRGFSTLNAVVLDGVNQRVRPSVRRLKETEYALRYAEAAADDCVRRVAAFANSSVLAALGDVRRRELVRAFQQETSIEPRLLGADDGASDFAGDADDGADTSDAGDACEHSNILDDFELVIDDASAQWLLARDAELERLLAHAALTKNAAEKLFASVLLNSHLRRRVVREQRFVGGARRRTTEAFATRFGETESIRAAELDARTQRWHALTRGGAWFARVDHFGSIGELHSLLHALNRQADADEQALEEEE